MSNDSGGSSEKGDAPPPPRAQSTSPERRPVTESLHVVIPLDRIIGPNGMAARNVSLHVSPIRSYQGRRRYFHYGSRPYLPAGHSQRRRGVVPNLGELLDPPDDELGEILGVDDIADPDNAGAGGGLLTTTSLRNPTPTTTEEPRPSSEDPDPEEPVARPKTPFGWMPPESVSSR